MAGEGEARVVRFPCRQCGADAEYAPGEGLKCPYCGQLEPEPASAAEAVGERDFAVELARAERGFGASAGHGVRCAACGAETTFSGTEAAGRCAFCAAPVVIESPRDDVIRPAGVAPFRVTKAEAVGKFQAWIGRLWFAPTALKRLARAGTLNGVYRPYWSFDAATHSWYRGERGDDHTVRTERRDSRGMRQVSSRTETRWRPVEGQVRKAFDDLLVPAGREVAGSLSLDLAGLKPYDPAYLAGFQAERYTTELEDGFRAAQQRMEAAIRAAACGQIGGDRQRIHSLKVSYDAVRFRHVLLPLWMSSYSYGGRTYRFLVSGQSGEVWGERPWSIWKIAGLLLALATLAAALAYLNGS